MADLKWSVGAKRDIKALAEYYDLSSPEYSRHLITTLYNSISDLQSFPKMGRKVPELNLESFRELIVEGYRIIYLEQSSSVEILSIVHSRQDLFKHLKQK